MPMVNPPTREPKSEENMPIRKVENYCETLRVRHVFYSRIHFGGNNMSMYPTAPPTGSISFYIGPRRHHQDSSDCSKFIVGPGRTTRDARRNKRAAIVPLIVPLISYSSILKQIICRFWNRTCVGGGRCWRKWPFSIFGNALRIKENMENVFLFENISFVDFEIGNESLGGDLEENGYFQIRQWVESFSPKTRPVVQRNPLYPK